MPEITLGGRYTDEHGTYTVLNLCGSWVKVMYADNSGGMISRAAHLKNLKKQQRESEQQRMIKALINRQRKVVNDVFLDPYTVGFLASRGFLYARCPLAYEKTFIGAFKEVTGLTPDPDHYSIDNNDKAWNALSSYIEFPPNDLVEFDELEINEQPNGRWRVCSNNYLWALLFIGFNLGSLHDIEKVTSHMSLGRDLYNFQRGFMNGELGIDIGEIGDLPDPTALWSDPRVHREVS